MDKYLIKQEKFEGPLDLLLELIDKEKLSINEISLAKVADDYIAYVKSLEKINPEALAEFLVVAAYLCLIKSRSLLPSLKITEEEEESLEELAKRLEEYKQIKILAGGIRKLAAEKRFIFSRDGFIGIDPIFYPPPKLSSNILRDAFAAFIETLPQIGKLAEEKIKKIISLEGKIKEIQFLLSKKIENAFSAIVKGSREKVEIIVSFLAILELAKQKFVELDQKKLFEDIVIKKL